MTDGVMETGGLSGVTTADRQPQAVPHTASAASVCVCVCVCPHEFVYHSADVHLIHIRSIQNASLKLEF